MTDDKFIDTVSEPVDSIAGITADIPMVALRGMVVFAHGLVHFDIGREPSIAALEFAKENDSYIFLVAQKDIRVFEPEPDDIYQIGTVCRIKQTLNMPGNVIRVLVEGISRAKIVSYTQTEPFFSAEVEMLADISDDPLTEESLFRVTVELMGEYIKLSDSCSLRLCLLSTILRMPVNFAI